MDRSRTGIHIVAVSAVLLGSYRMAWCQFPRLVMPEQGRIAVRDPRAFSTVPVAPTPRPPTVRSEPLPERTLSLDEAIRIALQNTDVVRILSGVGAASSGLTIYSPAIRNNAIDQARAEFDPRVTARNNFFRSETPGISDGGSIVGSRSDLFDFELDVTKRLLNGADASLRAGSDRSRPGRFLRDLGTLLDAESTSDVELSLTQPLLQGRGVDANSVPIVLAFLDTEQSYFRLKDALQNTVLGVIQGYWDLVQARTDLWVLNQQIKQAEFAYELATARKEEGIVDIGEVAQARATLANFRANLVTAEAVVLDRVASLRGILGLPPSSEFTIVPTTPPLTEALEFDWDALLRLAEERRPDLIELKLILEADRQRILQARNLAQPQLDAVARYRWNGLVGEMPVGDPIRARPGDFTDWTLGVTFSVPLTLRAERASLRQNELLLASDRVNLQQGILQATHSLAFNLRTLDQLYAQYVAFQESRAASAENLQLQFQRYLENITIFLDVLLAINTWGNSVTSEARSVTQYNTALASLERETGTILESHGVRLFEERYCSLGPLGQLGKQREYPATVRPAENTPRYVVGEEPAENAFDLRTPVGSSETERLPPIEEER